MPHPRPRMVTVYNYWIERGEDMHSDVSKDKAPLDVIVNEMHCAPLLGTAQEVPATALIEGKRYRRHPTGWTAAVQSAASDTRH